MGHLEIRGNIRLYFRQAFFLVFAISVFYPSLANAIMQGDCSGCHTMHNSQNNLPMRFDSEATPLPTLLREDCYGCHARGEANAIATVGTVRIPQVYHTDNFTDLAGGNFAYMTGAKGSIGGASETKGHNIAGLGGMGADITLLFPPGGIIQTGHYNGGNITSAQLVCAGDPGNRGRFGCHGNRDSFDAGYAGINGAHHDNLPGIVAPTSGEMRPGHSYRFLVGVKGYEDTDWQYSATSTDHNEYSGRSAPVGLVCFANSCHGDGGVRPPDGTMSQYCATCHGNFHTLSVGAGNDSGPGNSSGVGTGVSPFIRHPTDLSLPGTGEYLGHTTYSISTPVARLDISAADGTNGAVDPSADAVMCLSCHYSHGGPWPDLLRWDYSTMGVGSGGPDTGCFKCHTSKN